jgi:hypothetical protein
LSGGDTQRGVVNVIKARDGMDYAIDKQGEYWRMLSFIEDSVSFDKVEKPEQFYDSARAFGDFQYILRDYPADTLYKFITLPTDTDSLWRL